MIFFGNNNYAYQRALIILLTTFATIYSGANQQDAVIKSSIKQNLHRISSHSLNRFGACVYSQYGEDGIIEEIFKRLGVKKGFFVEFGAHDGIYLSNTRYLWENGWHGAMIEADAERFSNLQKNYSQIPEVLTIHSFVSWKKEKGSVLFDEIREKYFPEQEIDFLSIDIDGCDFYILKSLKCRPKVICIENGLKWHPLLDKEAPESMAKNNLHQPIHIVIEYARKIGYEPLCSTINLFLVKREFYHLFTGVPTDALTIWQDAFRSFPYKQYWIDCRKSNYPDIKIFEGQIYEELMPITLES